MSIQAPARPRPRFFNRLQCSRSGHRWERQILDSGAEARWVCTACGKLGDAIPVITPEQEVVEMTDEQEIPAAAAQDEADIEAKAGDAPVPESAADEAAADDTPADEVPEVVSAAADGETAGRRRNPVVVAAVAVTAVAVVSGITVFALRRRRR